MTRVVGRLVEEVDHGVVRVRADPQCEMYLGGSAPNQTCGRPATVRRNLWPHWSTFWCPEHAALFDEPRNLVPDFDFLRDAPDPATLDAPTFLRRVSV